MIDWRKRYEAISSVTKILYSYPDEFCAVDTRVVQLFDVFLDRLRDSNSKVNLYALQTLQEWAAVLKVGGIRHLTSPHMYRIPWIRC